MAPTLYVNKPGGVIAHTADGGHVHLKYGDVVPPLASHVDVSTFADKQQRVADPVAQQNLEANQRAALAEGGQVNSSSSPVPGNYSELDEDTAALLVSQLSEFPDAQAAIVRHEKLFGGNRQKIVDAASPEAQRIVSLSLGSAETDASGDEPSADSDDSEQESGDSEAKPRSSSRRSTPKPS